MRLVCFPHAGGSAVFYRPWAAAVSPAVELHAVQYPGRADRMRDPLIADSGQVSRLIAGAMMPLLDRPVAFFGHSMGAVLAYETARILHGRGTQVVHLFASGARAPHDREEPKDVAGMDDDGVVAEMVALGGTDAELLQDPEMRELVLPYVRNDFRLIESYRHKPGLTLATPITAILGDADPHVSPDEAARWADVTDAGFTRKVLAGDHFYLAPQQPAVLSEVHRTLNIPT
jgi:surfactin synthase thioesterase subunit